MLRSICPRVNDFTSRLRVVARDAPGVRVEDEGSSVVVDGDADLDDTRALRPPKEAAQEQ